MEQPYPQRRLIVIDAYSAFAAWIVAFVVVLIWLFGAFLGMRDNKAMGLAASAFVIFAVSHVLLSLTHRCPSCGRHPTIQEFRGVHKNAVPERGMSGWARVVWDVVVRRSFVCIHCGDVFSVGATPNKPLERTRDR